MTIYERLTAEQEPEQFRRQMAEEVALFPSECPPRLWPSCAADGAIRTALALPLRGTSPCSSEPPEACTATRSLARTTHLPDLPARCWLRLSHPYTITHAAPLALTYLIVKVTSCRTGP